MGAGTSSDAAFPFGRPVERRRPSAKSRRRVFVLGAHPDALHIAWWSPHRKSIKALPVDNEPAPFWTGADEKEQIDAWRKLVAFRIGEWGEVETSEEANGKVGRWIDAHVLAPLGVTRDEACFSYCVDTYLVPDSAAAFVVHERYQPFAREAGLAESHLAAPVREGAFVELAVTAHRERLLHELSVVVPEIVVTLGNAVVRVVREITATRSRRRLRPDETYGAAHSLTLGKREAVWLALTDPDPEPSFAEAHTRWMQSRSATPRAVP
jgi:hypothetical protein